MRFLCVFENVLCKTLYNGKNGVWNDSQTIWDSFQILAIIAEDLSFYVSETLVAYAGVCLWTYALAHVRRPLPMYVGQGLFWSSYFQK